MTLPPSEQLAIARMLRECGATEVLSDTAALRTRLETLRDSLDPLFIDALVAAVEAGGVRRLSEMDDGTPFEAIAVKLSSAIQKRFDVEPAIIAQALSVWAMARRRHVRGSLAALIAENPHLALDAAACREALVEQHSVNTADGTRMVCQQPLIDLLIRTIRAGVTSELQKLPADVSHQWIVPQLIERLHGDGLETWQANWAIETWAFVLGRPPGDVGIPEPERPRSIARRVLDAVFGAVSLGLLAALIAASLWRHDEMVRDVRDHGEIVQGYADSLQCALWGLGIGAFAGLILGRHGAESVRAGSERAAVSAAVLSAGLTGAAFGWLIAVVNLWLPWQTVVRAAFWSTAVLGLVNGFRGRQPAGRIGCLSAIGYGFVYFGIYLFTDDVGSFYPSDAPGGMEVFLVIQMAVTSTVGWWIAKRTNERLGLRNGHRFRQNHTTDVSQVAILHGSDPESSGVVVASCANDDAVVQIWSSSSDTAIRLQGHSLAVQSVAFSPDGTRLASAGRDLQVLVWDTADWQCHRRLEGNWKAINAVAFSLDGTQVAAGSDDATLRTWDATTGEALDCRDHDSPVVKVAACPVQCGCWITATTDGKVRVWKTRAVTPELISDCGDEITCLAVVPTDSTVSPDGAVRIAFGSAGRVTVVDFGGDEPHESTFEVEQGETVHDIRFSPDGKRLYAAIDTSIRCLDLTRQSWKTVLEPSRTINSLDVTTDDSTLATGGAQGIVWLRPLATRAVPATSRDPDSVPALVQSPLSVRCLSGFTLWFALVLGAGCAGSALGLIAGIVSGPFLVSDFDDALQDEAGWVPVVQRAISDGVDWAGWLAVAVSIVPAAVVAHAWMLDDWNRTLVRAWGARTTRRLVRPISALTGMVSFTVSAVQWHWGISLIAIGFTVAFLILGVGLPLIFLSWFCGQCVGLRQRTSAMCRATTGNRFHALLPEDTLRERRQLDRAMAFSYGLMLPGFSLLMGLLLMFFTFVPTDGTASGRGASTTDFEHPQFVPVDEIVQHFASDPLAADQEYTGYDFQFRGIVQDWETAKLRLRTVSGTLAAECLLDDETAHDLLVNQFKVDDWERVQLQSGQPAILFGECLGPDARNVIQFRNCRFHYSTFDTDIQASLAGGTTRATVETENGNVFTGHLALMAYSVTLISGFVFLVWLQAARSISRSGCA